MKVWFAGDTAQDSPRFGVRLDPGENDVPDAAGAAMVACGLVSAGKGKQLSARELKAAKDPRD